MATAKKKKRTVKRQNVAKSAAKDNVASANTQGAAGQVASAESAVNTSERTTRSASVNRQPRTRSAAVTSQPRTKSAAATSQPSATETGAGTGPMAPKQSLGLVPFFEGANAFDPEIGYFQVPPGRNPTDVLNELKMRRSQAK